MAVWALNVKMTDLLVVTAGSALLRSTHGKSRCVGTRHTRAVEWLAVECQIHSQRILGFALTFMAKLKGFGCARCE